MKKLFLIFALLLLVLTACACNGEPDYAGYDIEIEAEEPEGPQQTEELPPEPVVIEPEEPEPLPETVIFSMTEAEYIQGLEHGTYGGGEILANSPGFMQAGSPTYTIVPCPAGDGNSIKLSDRRENFYALDVYFNELDITFGPAYAVKATGRAEAGITMQLGRTDAPWSAFVTATVPASGEWALTHILSEAELMEHFVSNQRGVRIMTSDAPNAEFVIDSVEVVRIGERGGGDVIMPEWDLSAPSLAQSFAQHFLFGNIWSTASNLDSFNTHDGFLHHFNAVTAENNHKVDTIARNRGTWTFDTADFIVNWAEENNLAMIGHTLVWHSQSPPWLTTEPGGTEPLTRAEAIENMHLYISTVAGRYAGRMYAWDVVNEAIWGVDGSSWRRNPDWRAYMRQAGQGLEAERQSQWYNAFANGAADDECGSDFIYYAFRFARIYDPFAILYYNDYNDHVPGKRDAIAQMVVQINERWQDDPLYDGRLLIEGIGMQAHYSIRGWMTEPHHVRDAIELYITTGARISITELDITIGGNHQNPATATPELFEEQAARFGLLMSWYLEFSDYIERVTLWGLADHHSWIRWGYPLLFDANFQTKPAFYAIMDALENAPAPNISVPAITTENIPNGRNGTDFAYQLTATQNNFVPVRWSVTDSELPPGLRLVSATGVILGTPTQSGSFSFTVTAENAAGGGTRELTITVS